MAYKRTYWIYRGYAMQWRKSHWDLRSTLFSKLEMRMAPKHVYRKGPFHPTRFGMTWRNHLSYRIWKKPHRFTQAGIPTVVSEVGRRHGFWPWETRLMTFDEVMGLITRSWD